MTLPINTDTLRNTGTKRLLLGVVVFVLFSLSVGTIVYTYVNSTRKDSPDNSSVASSSSTLSVVASSDTVTSYTTSEDLSSSESTSSSSTTESSIPVSTSISTQSASTSTVSTSQSTSSVSSSTPPEVASAFVAFYSDTQSDSDSEDTNHQRVVNYILASGANPVFHAGDVMEDGTEDSLNRFNAVTSTLRSTRTFYAALGNNDRVYGDASTPSTLFLNNFSFPNNERWYSINTGNLHVVVLDSAFASGSTDQMNWLVSDLSGSGSQSRITVVMFHHPSFRSAIATYLVNYGVEFVIAGHDHSYQHTNPDGVHTFVMSGQPSIGYMTATVYESSVTLTEYNSSNVTVESVVVSER